MHERIHIPWLLAMVLVLGSCHATARAADPQATFALVDGEIQIRVQLGGKGIKDAKVRVLDFAVQSVAEGECDDQGEGTFPLPRSGRTFLIGISIPGKKKEADIIVLRREGKDGLTPSRVLLSFSKPCCRATATASANAEEEPPRPRFVADWMPWLTAGGGCLLAAGTLLLFFRRG